MPLDEDVVAAIYRDHGAALRRFVLSASRDPQLADDVVQETVLRVWQQAPQITGSLRSYLFRTARNIMIDNYRKAQRRPREADGPRRRPTRPAAGGARRRAAQPGPDGGGAAAAQRGTPGRPGGPPLPPLHRPGGIRPVEHPERNGEVPGVLRRAGPADDPRRNGGAAVNGDRAASACSAPTCWAGWSRPRPRPSSSTLAVCADCRQELDELASLPALLDALPVPDAVALTAHGGRPGTGALGPPEPATRARAGCWTSSPPAAGKSGAGGRRRWPRRPPRAWRWGSWPRRC